MRSLLHVLSNRFEARNVMRTYRKLLRFAGWLVYDALILAPVFAAVVILVAIAKGVWYLATLAM